MSNSLKDQLLGLGFKQAPKPERAPQDKGGKRPGSDKSAHAKPAHGKPAHGKPGHGRPTHGKPHAGAKPAGKGGRPQSREDIDLWVLHQANTRIIDAAVDCMEIDRSKVVIHLDRYGNTSAGSVPIAIDESFRAGRIKRGTTVLMSGFGAGLSWGTAVFRW